MTTTRQGRERRRRTMTPLTGGRSPAPAKARDVPRPIPEMETFAAQDAIAAQAAAGIGRLREMFGTLQRQVGQTFDVWEQVLDEKAKAKRAQESEQLGREATRVAFTNPDEIDAIVRSGDPRAIAALSKLQGIDANRPEFIEVLKAQHAKNMAIRDYQDKFLPALQGLDYMSGNPRALLNDFLNTNLAGSGQFFDMAYRQTFTEMAHSPIGKWLEHQRDFMLNRQTETLLHSSIADIRSGGEINPHQLIGEAMATGRTPSEKLQIRDRVIFELFRTAQESGHPALMKALAEPDPDNHGLSLADQHRELWDEATRTAIGHWRAVNSLEAEQDLGRLDLLMTAIQSGVVQPINTPEGEIIPDSDYLMTELLLHSQRYGVSETHRGMVGKTLAMIGKELEYEANYATFSNALLTAASSPDAGAPYVSSKAMNEHGSTFAAQYLAAAQADGMHPAEAMGRLAKVAANYGGFGTEYNSQMEHNFVAGTPEEMIQAFNFYSAVERSQAFPGAAAAMISDAGAKARFDFMYTLVERFSGDPAQAIASFQEAARQRGDTNWRGYANKVLPQKDLDRWVDDIEKAVRKHTKAEIPWGLRQVMQEELSRQMWMTSPVTGEHLSGGLFSSSTKDLYVASVAKGIMDRVEVGYDPVHQRPTAVMRSSPRIVMLPDKSVKQMPGLTAKDHDLAREAFRADIMPVFGNLFGDGVVGLSTNSEARKGRGAVVYVENNVGDRGELYLPYGTIDVAETIRGGVSVLIQGPLPEGMSWNADGTLTIQDGIETRIGNFTIAPHPTMDGMAAVYYVGPTPATHQELLAQQRADLEERAVELEKERTAAEVRIETRKEMGWPYTPREKKPDAPIEEEKLTAEEQAIRELAWPTRKPAPTSAKPAEQEPRVATVPEAIVELPVPGRGDEGVGTVDEEVPVPGPEAVEPTAPLGDALEREPAVERRGTDLEDLNRAISLREKLRELGARAASKAEDIIADVRDVFVAAPDREYAEEMGRGAEPDITQSWTNRFRGWLSDLTSRGAIDGDTAVLASRMKPEDATQFLGGVESTKQLAQVRDAPLTSRSTPAFVERVADHIFKEEGYRSRSYQDGRTRSIGYGFNLQRTDFKKILQDFGYDLGKVWKGEQAITKEHANAIRDYEIGRLMGVIKKDLRGAGVPEHVMMSLIDMAYNLGEGRVRPITRLVREGKLEEAAKAIITIKPPSWLSARVQEVVRQRRIRNAYMLLGHQVIKP